ncbi:substrate-binding domain-containing protein [Paenibacillus sp.]|uniref:substrate-binding domain-containing protein n=1 Tax=Paenibacillus sp. TaxID=58172 RepID=UPI002D4574CA|nr:substrate-binding domain-containing protein [Paenibacillus sp.]HZG86848.1 substrate-binding domain-containing protein [Paenibacillus sp.]
MEFPRRNFHVGSWCRKALQGAAFALAAVSAGCAPMLPAASGDSAAEIVLATTTSTQDSGLLDTLLPVFEEDTGIRVDVVAVGTGQAIQLGKDGNADVLLVHDRQSEDAFVSEGYGVNAYDVMYNQFLLAGPSDDPAGVRGAGGAADALSRIASSGAPFVSRGDDSGTHKKELSLWKQANIDPAGLEGYISAGQGMCATLKMTDEKRGYTLSDEATFLACDTELAPVLEGDAGLQNPYGVIQVASTKHPDEAARLIAFLTGETGQRLIGEFGKDEYGKPLFTPNAKQR